MKKMYFQPEIELLTISALEDFLIGSPGGDERFEDGVTDDNGWVTDGSGNDFVGGDHDEWA